MKRVNGIFLNKEMAHGPDTDRLLKRIDLVVDTGLWLHICDLRIDSLPELPSRLKVLDCRDSTLTRLPHLHSGLKALYCKDNFIEQLPELPDSLVTLQCNYKQLSSLTCLPESLKEIWCTDSPHFPKKDRFDPPWHGMSKFIVKCKEDIDSKNRILKRCSAIKEDLIAEVWSNIVNKNE